MPELKPFRAIRPEGDDPRAYCGNSDLFSSDREIIEYLRDHPDHLLHLTKMHLMSDGMSQRDDAYFEAVQQFSSRIKSNSNLIRDDKPAFYVYRQWINGIHHTGILGLVDIEDYMNDQIKRHENTRVDREKFIARLFDSTKLIAQSVLMGHRHHEELHDLLKAVVAQTHPVLDFKQDDIHHQLWVVENPQWQTAIAEFVKQKKALYIMDGHHRIATIARLYKEYGTEEYRYLPAYLLDEHQLHIDPFHRLVKDSGVGQELLIRALEAEFEIRPLVGDLHPKEKGQFTLVTNGEAFELEYRGNRSFELDVYLIEELVLNKVLGITDTRHDDRIEFVKGDSQLRDAIELSITEGTHLFMLHPCSFEEVCTISDRGEVMPPKSTSIEPKSIIGLVNYNYGE